MDRHDKEYDSAKTITVKSFQIFTKLPTFVKIMSR